MRTCCLNITWGRGCPSMRSKPTIPGSGSSSSLRGEDGNTRALRLAGCISPASKAKVEPHTIIIRCNNMYETMKPDLSPRTMELDVNYVRQLLGVDLEPDRVKDLLERMRFGVGGKGDTLEVSIPAFRSDILHPIDLVEDVAIAYGYMKFDPEVPRLYTLGREDGMESYCETVREAMVGLGFREAMTLVLTSRRDLFERMHIPEEDVVETVKPVSQDQSVARSWLLPSLMGVLENNRNREYPQRIFEVGDVLSADGSNRKAVAGVIAHGKTNYSEVKAVVSGLLRCLGLGGGEEGFEHGSFIKGRCGRSKYGFYGEVRPEVLESYGLEVPVTAFEFRLE
ncbi:MAG: hypothetical protein GF416_04150 [Candidatus Altiarchaeales archaeon]|nr:hypothetical protein [Candidatus Altiarchaeales archaeon]MBD3416312.1 hypothetical protein [Candidatus Altiarchaeales archaeon]